MSKRLGFRERLEDRLAFSDTLWALRDRVRRVLSHFDSNRGDMARELL
jgi:hypothetical protein